MKISGIGVSDILLSGIGVWGTEAAEAGAPRRAVALPATGCKPQLQFMRR